MLNYTFLLHHLITHQAKQTPKAQALLIKNKHFSYQQLLNKVYYYANILHSIGIKPNDRLAVYLPKNLESVVIFFSSSITRSINVPINPVLKNKQVKHILDDCSVRLLVTSSERLKSLQQDIEQGSYNSLDFILLIDNPANIIQPQFHIKPIKIYSIEDFPNQNLVNFYNSNPDENIITEHGIDTDIVAIFYTSGSSGKPKGVVVSHRNLLAGAQSVNQYLNINSKDKILSVLPFSFDYGFNQLTSAFLAGASVALIDYLLPQDIFKAIEEYQITGLAAVPSLWIQLVHFSSIKLNSLRYFTNSGGTMPTEVLKKLQLLFPQAKPYLMYGLTESFRSTYVPPEYLGTHEESIGIAIPNAEILVLREDGSICDDNEPGELVHLGVLVTQGYWNNIEKTAHRFKKISVMGECTSTEMAVWSGDIVRRAQDGYLYFISRKDDMIKTSGYRVSPDEIETIMYQLDAIHEGVALGINHPELGQAIILIISLKKGYTGYEELSTHLKKHLPNYMLPRKIIIKNQLPRNINGKLDKQQLKHEYHDIFQNSNDMS